MRVATFVVSVIETPAGLYAVVERVKTGRKERVEHIEHIGGVIASMVLSETADRGGATAHYDGDRT